ncbi:hypothetical protein [Ligilactobacillus salivarius]|uniref:Uncharacterized protein n=1 Tax=Ligilactobacillus salivarius NIAS840 TaxID=1029822 RepID=F5VG16_9LACO|nr:hypothetical protein [Ligilactobacillus salivarius]EGL98305.1 hypothetical protein NIAS840_01736 [Ligilactobacillus salivarius NIAS840]
MYHSSKLADFCSKRCYKRIAVRLEWTLRLILIVANILANYPIRA